MVNLINPGRSGIQTELDGFSKGVQNATDTLSGKFSDVRPDVTVLALATPQRSLILLMAIPLEKLQTEGEIAAAESESELLDASLQLGASNSGVACELTAAAVMNDSGTKVKGIGKTSMITQVAAAQGGFVFDAKGMSGGVRADLLHTNATVASESGHSAMFGVQRGIEFSGHVGQHEENMHAGFTR